MLANWTIYRIPSTEHSFVDTITHLPRPTTTIQFQPINYRIPSIYSANFTLPNVSGYPLDSFLRADGWGKGIAFLNGYNLGRYWPVAGPQITLYAPGPYFNQAPELNRLILLELDESPCWYDPKNGCQVQFVKEHIVNGTYAQ